MGWYYEGGEQISPLFGQSIKEDMQRRIIFVGGVHGVGKTTLCNSLCSKFNVIHHSASGLISKLKQVDFSSNKQTNDIEGNQNSLITAINDFLDHDKYCLLDGHFCLIDQDGKVSKIPHSTYAAMSPAAIILLHDDPKNIHSRLRERDKEKYNMDLLDSFQEEEISYSRTVASDLEIPYLKANPFVDRETIFNFVANLLERGDFL